MNPFIPFFTKPNQFSMKKTNLITLLLGTNICWDSVNSIKSKLKNFKTSGTLFFSTGLKLNDVNR